MNEVVKQKNFMNELDDLASENIYDLEKAKIALNMLIDKYEWDYEPTAYAAIAYGKSIPGSPARRDENNERSWDYIMGYKEIMWMVGVARDYCVSALERCNKVYDMFESCEHVETDCRKAGATV